MSLKKFFLNLFFKVDTSKLILVQDPFLQEIFEIWSEVNFDDRIKTKQQFLEHIWHNLLIRIENRPVFYKHLFLHGITKVAQLMMDSHRFLPLADFISTQGVVLKKVLYGEAPPQGPTPYPFIYHFFRKGTPFEYLLLEKGTPFKYLLKKTYE